MALGMGPEVADAYIQVHADTDAFRRQLRRRLARDLEGFAKKANKTFKDYLNIDEAADWESFHRNLSRATRSGDFSRLHKQFKDTGDWVGEVTDRLHRLRDVMIEARDAEGEIEQRRLYTDEDINRIRESLGLYVQELRTAQNRDVRNFYNKLADRYEEDYRKFSDTQRRKRLQVEQFYTNLANKYEADYSRLRETLRRQEITTEAFYRRLGNQYDRQYQAQEKVVSAFYTNLAKKYQQDYAAFVAAEGRKQDERDRMNRLHATALREFGAWEKRKEELRLKEERERSRLRLGIYANFFDGLKASRSEFIHGIGIVMDAFATMLGFTIDNTIRGIKRLRGYFEEGGGGTAKMFEDLQVGWGKFGSTFKASIPGIIASVVVLAASFQAFGLLLIGITNIISGLAAMLVGLASSVGMAIVALLPIAGVLTAAAYGGGLLVAALKDMDKYLPGAVGGLEELKRVFSEIDVRAFAEEIEGPLNNLFRALAESLRGDEVAGALGEAFGSIITSLTGLVQSGSWKAFMTALETVIPDALANFGGGFTGLLQGFMSVFAAGAPGVERVSEAFKQWGVNYARTMDEMRANGSLESFFDTAAESLMAVSGLIDSVLKALLGLFEAAAPAGNQMLTDLSGLVDKFTEWVTSAEGKNSVADWMSFGRDMARELGGVVKEVWELFRDLDTPENREFALNVVRAIGSLIEIITRLGQGASAMWKFWLDLRKGAQDAEAAIEGFMTRLGEWFSGVLEGARKWAEDLEASIEGVVSNIGSWFGDVGEWFSGMWQSIIEWWNNVDWLDVAHSIWEGFDKGLREAWTYFAEGLRTIFQPFIDQVKAFFGIASPSTVFMQFGRDIVEGLRLGIEEAWTTFIGWITGTFSNLTSTASKTWETIQKDATAKWETIRKNVTDKVEAVRKNVTDKVEAARTALSTKWEQIKTSATQAWETVRTTVNQKIESVRTSVVSKVSAVQTSLSNAWSNAKTVTSQAWESLRSAVATKIDQVVAKVKGLPGSITGALTGIGLKLYYSGRDMIQGFIDGITAKARSVIAAVTGVVNGAIAAARRLLGIHSPSRVFRNFGQDTGEGFALGILDKVKRTENALARLTALPDISAPGANVNPPGLGLSAAYGGNSRTVNVAPGAIQINTRASNPRIVAGMMLDDLAAHSTGL